MVIVDGKKYTPAPDPMTGGRGMTEAPGDNQ
jgi:hypothetical protein